MNNGDMPATAVDRYTITEEVQIKGAQEGTTMTQGVAANGLTKREAFAMAAMQGLLTTDPNNHVDADQIASWSIECANALLKALEEEK